MKMTKNCLVTGAAGFIGSNLCKFLKDKAYWVRGVDIRVPEFMHTEDIVDEWVTLDLRAWDNCVQATKDIDHVYNLAANMGGIGYITAVHAEVASDNIRINANMLEASRVNHIERFFFSSSACVYPVYKQTSPNIPPLKESDAYPADPDNEYGWEKLFTERLCMNYAKDYGMTCRIARYHNIYGPRGTWAGGREKSPAALCRKVAEAPDGGTITIWGDGKQTRSFCYIDDCLEGTYRLMMSNHDQPLNIGSERMITIDDLADIIIRISGKDLHKTYDLRKPQGVRGRASDNTMAKRILNWEPQVPLEQGLARTYAWIKGQVREHARVLQ